MIAKIVTWGNTDCRFVVIRKTNGTDLRKKTPNEREDAFSLFPDVLDGISRTPQRETKKSPFGPPPAPDISWLKTGQDDDSNTVIDVPTALILMTNQTRKAFVSNVLEELGYQAEFTDAPLKAIERLQFSNISVIIQHTDFEVATLSDSIFYNYLKKLPMKKRRYIFYLLTGPDFHTLYDLEALSCSANLVVNDRDLKYLNVILKKSFHDFEELFSNLISIMDGARH